jgi:hypothetical protein
MWRWKYLFFWAFVTLFAIAHLISVHDYVIELQPDGKSLGKIPAEQIRVIAAILASLPLILLAVIVAILQENSADDRAPGGLRCLCLGGCGTDFGIRPADCAQRLMQRQPQSGEPGTSSLLKNSRTAP